MTTRHFLSLLDFSPTELQTVIQRAIELKKKPINQNFNGKVLSMVFEKASTRTRISFEAGMAQMGGSAIFLSPRDTQLGRGEPIEDSARVISSMTDIVMIRTFAHETIETFAEYSSVPVINALTDALHPCQLLADMQTFYEQRGSIQGKKVTWVGDGNNMCQSYINAAKQFDFELSIACPKGFEPDAAMLTANSDRVTVLDDPQTAVANADLVVTDVWASMGQEDQQGKRLSQFAPYQVNHKLMEAAAKNALFMHCLPAHRGEEVTDAVIDSRNSIVLDQAENRMWAQMSLLTYLCNNDAWHAYNEM